MWKAHRALAARGKCHLPSLLSLSLCVVDLPSFLPSFHWGRRRPSVHHVKRPLSKDGGSAYSPALSLCPNGGWSIFRERRGNAIRGFVYLLMSGELPGYRMASLCPVPSTFHLFRASTYNVPQRGLGRVFLPCNLFPISWKKYVCVAQ